MGNAKLIMEDGAFSMKFKCILKNIMADAIKNTVCFNDAENKKLWKSGNSLK